jgi:GNAT superfamily N-acetyltransferase
MPAGGPAVIAPFEWDEKRITLLANEARREGFTHIDRLIGHWRDGSNRFDREGEALLAALSGSAIVAVGGLTIDPYQSDPRVGRVRHLYVMPDQRRTGVGRRLVQRILGYARGSFDTVRVRAAKGDAPLFYDAIGFQRVEEPDASHRIRI